MVSAARRALLRSFQRFAASHFLEAERSCTLCQNANFTVVPAQLQSKQRLTREDTVWYRWIAAGVSGFSNALDVTSNCALKLHTLAGATLVAVQMTTPAQAKAEVNYLEQLTAFPGICINKAHCWFAGSTQECCLIWTTCCH